MLRISSQVSRSETAQMDERVERSDTRSAEGAERSDTACLDASHLTGREKENTERSEAMPALINLLIVLLVMGVILWLINTYLPLDPLLRGIINAVVVLILIVWLLHLLGYFPLGRWSG